MLSTEYIAGFVDGEGSIEIAKAGYRGQPRIAVANTDIGILTAMKQTLEYWEVTCSIHAKKRRSPKHRIVYHLIITNSPSVLAFCQILRDSLKLKQRHADIIIEFIGLRYAEGMKGLEHLDKEMDLIEEIRYLNKRGT